MKKKSKIIKNCYRRLNNPRSLALFLFTALVSLLLAGCAKTGYPNPPKVAPPAPPVILSAEKLENSLRIIYKYNGNVNKIKGFLIYRKYFKDKKSIKYKYSCASSAPFVFQNLEYKKRFSLQYNKFFNNVNSKNLKKGYYMFCMKSVGYYGIKSPYSNYLVIFIK